MIWASWLPGPGVTQNGPRVMLCPVLALLGAGLPSWRVPVLQDIPCQVLARAPGVDGAGELVAWGRMGGEWVLPVTSCP